MVTNIVIEGRSSW